MCSKYNMQGEREDLVSERQVLPLQLLRHLLGSKDCPDGSDEKPENCHLRNTTHCGKPWKDDE